MATIGHHPCQFVVLELGEAYAAFVYGHIKQGELQLDTSVFRDSTSLNLDTPKERRVRFGG